MTALYPVADELNWLPEFISITIQWLGLRVGGHLVLSLHSPTE